MGKNSNISWTDNTFSPVWGCTAVSVGCDHCFAEAFDKRVGGAHWGKGSPRRTFSDKHWDEPLKWNREAQKSGDKIKVFCGSMCDVMDDEWPDGVRERLWDLIDRTPYLIWQLLTKRPHRYNRYLPPSFAHNNVWLGTSAENQQYYDVRWPILRLACKDYGLTSWISYEPALGPLSMDECAVKNDFEDNEYPNWIIFGGETGSGHRPMELWWAEQVKQEAKDAGVAFFMKQMGGSNPAKAAELIPASMLIHEWPNLSHFETKERP